jgi:carbon storage regulator CsrA
MLVLSRRLNERIVFPGTNISVRVVAIKQGTVRLGIDAPPAVTILREEVPDRAVEWGPAATHPTSPAAAPELRKINRLLRNRLKAGSADLRLLRRQIRAGLLQDAEETLDKMQQDFELVRQ